LGPFQGGLAGPHVGLRLVGVQLHQRLPLLDPVAEADQHLDNGVQHDRGDDAAPARHALRPAGRGEGGGRGGVLRAGEPGGRQGGGGGGGTGGGGGAGGGNRGCPPPGGGLGERGG